MNAREWRGQTLDYIAALTGDANASLTWQLFDDGPDKDFRRARIVHGPLVELAHELQSANASKCGVFACVAQTDGKGRKAANVQRVRALFVDCDTVEPAAWHVPPSIIVRSAAGPHAYWLVDDCELTAFQSAQKRLAAHYSSDPKVCDLPRVLRVPGYWHCKREPVRVVLESAPGTRYRTADVLQDIAELSRPPLSPYVRTVPRTEREPMLPSERRKFAQWRGIDALHAFRDAGLYGRHIDGDKHAVVCPWINAHTSRDYTGLSGDTVLWTSSRDGAAVFHCAHAHCDGKYLVHALAEIGAMEA